MQASIQHSPTSKQPSIHTPLRFNFIKTNVEAVHWHNTIIGTVRPLRFVFKSDAYELRFLRAKPSGYDAKIYFKLLLNKKSLCMGLTPLPPIELFDTSLKDLSFQTLPPDVIGLLLEGFAADLFKNLESSLKAELSLEDAFFVPPKEIFDHTLYFKIVNTKTKAEYLGHFWLNSQMMDFFSNKIALTPPLGISFWNKVLLPGSIHVGTTSMSRENFLSIEKNDIILLDDGTQFQKGIYTLDFGYPFSFQFQYQKGKANFLKMSETPPQIPTNTQKPAASSPAPQTSEGQASPVAQRLDQLRVHLSFDLGHKAMSIQELRTISEGFTFELDNLAQKPVQINLNGTIIGTGELLQIGDKVGVRVVEFNSHG